ncbi:2-octaprenyl-6-methoxyphenyl hydroxylase [Thalassotalea sp. Y01]|nr:2-octaprenyl-6-methoxyphenyl hydroxylase [Thalassotalea sp. Y01]
MVQQSEHFDVIISGGGLAGASMALALAGLRNSQGEPLSIAVIEAGRIVENLLSSFDARVIALANGSAAYLQQLDAWPEIKPHAMAINNIHISDRGHYGKARLYSDDYDTDALGFVVEMQAIGNGLYKALRPYNNVRFIAEHRITEITWQKNQVDVELQHQAVAEQLDKSQSSNTLSKSQYSNADCLNDASATQTLGQHISAHLLLACDGGQSVCRRKAAIDSSQYDYQQVAIIANVKCDKPHNGRAFERFTDSGPLAMLPMTEDRCSLVWTVKPDQVEQFLALDDNGFAAQLQQHFGGWLGSIGKVGKRFSFPLKLIRANSSIYHRMALVGNASHTLHPIAGQGFNLGVRDVKQMASLIAKALAAGQDIGNFALLQEYSQHRQKDHDQVISLTDSMVHLFSNDYLPLAIGRGIGLKVLNYLSPLKQQLARKTMGHID